MRQSKCRRRCGLRQIILLSSICTLLTFYRIYTNHYWFHHVLDVVIVEEHHEVLPYWYEAAWSGKLQLRHNTLLHVDAHSDMAPPRLARRFPFFRSAETKKEVRAMMQRNDVFIVASLISKLLHRVVWTWPSWDAASHTADYDHQILEVGTVRLRMSPEDEEETEFCLCSVDRRGKECAFMNRTDPVEGDDSLDPEDCAIRGKGVYEVVRDNATHAKMLAGNWFPSPLFSTSSSFILDIDEDFFGTESPAERLFRESRLSWPQIQRITELVSELLCPMTVETETASDKLVGSLIDTVIFDCKTPVGFDQESPLRDKKGGACETVLQDVRSFVDAFLQRTLDTKLNLLCSGDKLVLLSRIEKLTNLFISLSLAQLKTLQQVGFCLKASPKTLFWEYITEFHTFGVCCGMNVPNDTVVTYHYPTSQEINDKMKQLQRILSSRKFPTPGIVTIARSMRDGYTSKPHFGLIEDSLIQVLTRVFAEKEVRVIYDEDLMSGKEGRRWKERIDVKPAHFFGG